MQEGTWACLRWRSPFFPGAGRRRPCSGAARWGMQTRTQNQRAQAWSQEAAAAQWPFGERKTTGQSALTVRCGMLWEQGPDRYFSSSQALPAVLANTTCCSALKHKPSKGLPQIVLPELSRVHLNVHSMGPTTSMLYWAEGRELFIRRKTSLCPTRNGFQAFWHSGSRVAQSLYHFHSIFTDGFYFWMSDLLTICFYTITEKSDLWVFSFVHSYFSNSCHSTLAFHTPHLRQIILNCSWKPPKPDILQTPQ